MIIEIGADNEQPAEAMVREAYSRSGYNLDAEYFTGVNFITREKKWILEVNHKSIVGRTANLLLLLFFGRLYLRTTVTTYNTRPCLVL